MVESHSPAPSNVVTIRHNPSNSLIVHEPSAFADVDDPIERQLMRAMDLVHLCAESVCCYCEGFDPATMTHDVERWPLPVNVGGSLHYVHAHQRDPGWRRLCHVSRMWRDAEEYVQKLREQLMAEQKAHQPKEVSR